MLPTTRDQWQQALNELPSSPERIPAFFFAHGQPMLIWPKTIAPKDGAFNGAFDELYKTSGPEGPLAQFLHDFGKTLIEKYHPKAVVVFSAHWESPGSQILVSDYGAENPLLMDYYGFPEELYRVTFKSKGDSAVSQQVVSLLKEAGIDARTSPPTEARGEDGRGFSGPGLDHGVFVPFKLMFGDEFDIPVIQVSIDGSLDPKKEWALGKAVASLRSQEILVLSGGLTYHNLRDVSGLAERTAQPNHKGFHNAIIEALQTEEPEVRQQAMYNLTKHAGFRASHPREDHFVPIYVAAGAGEDGAVKIIGAQYSIISAAFGL